MDKHQDNEKNGAVAGASRLLGNAYLRAVNRSRVMELFRGGARLSRSDVARYLELTKPTVSTIVDVLIDQGVLRMAGRGPSDGGRRAELLEMNPASATFVGIHFGEELTQVAIADAVGRTLCKRAIPTVFGDPEGSMRAAASLVMDGLGTVQLEKKHISAVGISVPGLVERRTGMCHFAPNLKWRDVPLQQMAAGLFDAPVTVANTTQAAALAESQMGVARGVNDFVWVYVGHGVGSCAVVDGRIQYGRRGYAGEIGHCKVVESGLVCGCGSRGCLETVCSNRSIIRQAQAGVDSGRETVLPSGIGAFNARDVSQAASDGDQLAREVMTQAGSALGLGVSHLINIQDPQMVVVGGSAVGEDEVFLDALKQRALSESVDASNVSFAFSYLGSDIYLTGAFLMAMEQANAAYRIVWDTRPGATLPGTTKAVGL